MERTAGRTHQSVSLVAIFLVGALAEGALLVQGSALASSHQHSTTLERRVTRLEGQVAVLKRTVRPLRTSVQALNAKTSKLDTSGNYSGQVGGHQVTTPFPCGGSTAVWDNLSQYLDC